MPMPTQLAEALRGRLIVSCQAWPGDPLNEVEVIRRLARVAVRNGAGGIRANGPEDIAAIRADTDVPIIGIQKVYFDSEIRITPDFAAASSIAEAGASIIALDCTGRPPLAGERWQEILPRIHTELRLPVMADIATLEEARAAVAAGADMVGTTLCGYTAATAHRQGVPWELLAELVGSLDVPVILEGHIGSPEEARRGIEMGAFAVVVGTAITRPGDITARFVRALRFPAEEAWALGIDVGGSTVKAGLVRADGRIEHTLQIATGARQGRDAIAAAIAEAGRLTLDAARAAGIVPVGAGVATAGVVEVDSGSVFAASDNLPGWTGFDLRGFAEAAFALPAYVENDAHAAALAELRWGLGRRLRSFAAITIGTGLGCGIVIGGKLLRGARGFGGSIGHTTIRFDGVLCNCGRRGCLEAYVSAPALVRDYAARSGGDATGLTAEEVAGRAAAGDAHAAAALDFMAGCLADGLANLWNCVDPEAVILSGGMARNAGWTAYLETALAVRLPFAAQRHPRILTSQAGLYAGVRGATAPVFEALAAGELQPRA